MGKNDYLNEFKFFNPWILSTGLVTWIPEVRLHTKCVIRVFILILLLIVFNYNYFNFLKKVKDFPFDTQCCEINFYSWAHSSSQLIVQQFDNKNVTNLTHLVSSTEW